MKKKRPHLLFCFFFLLFQYSYSQSYITEFTTYGIEDGLSGRVVNIFFEDNKGFVWIGTTRGLSRFDGHNFKVFFNKENEFQPTNCTNIVEDVHGNIWTGFHGSIKKESSITYHSVIDSCLNVQTIDCFFAGKMPFLSEEISYVCQIEDNILYILTAKGQVFKYDGAFTLLATSKDYQGARITKTSNQHYLKLTLSNRCVMLDLTKPLIKEVISYPKPIQNQHVSELFPLFLDGFYESLRADFIKQANNQQLDVHKVPADYITRKTLNNEIIYIGTGQNCLALFDKDMKLVYDFSGDLSKRFNKVFTSFHVFVRNHQIWFTNDNGFVIMDFYNNPFQQYSKETTSLSTRGLIELPNKNILVASYNGLYEINPYANEIYQVHEMNGIWGMAKQDKEHLVLGMHDDKIRRYHTISQEITEIHLEKEHVQQHKGNSFLIPFKDSQNKIWISGTLGFFYYDTDANVLKPFTDYHSFKQLKKAKVNYLHEDKEGI